MMHPSRSQLLLGVDAGTTTLSLILFDAADASVVQHMTLPNDARMPGSEGQTQQDAKRIADRVLDAVSSLLCRYPSISAIGVTGQMHGVVCLDENGNAVSPLYTWQNSLADSSICADILQKTGYTVYPGYGHATLYALARQGQLQACQYCTVMDYIVMRLTGRKAPLMHATNAASLGLWDLKAHHFDEDALRALALSPLRTPEVTADSCIAGRYKGIPVSVAIGDNQASFFGSVADEARSLLLNYGTGSQLSLVCSSPDTPGGEIRPYLNRQYLLCRSALCGGRAYAMLERFFREFLSQAGYKCMPQYETLNALAAAAYAKGKYIRVHTQFCGTREEPDLRGSITGIGEADFTPGALALGVLQGMADELHDGFNPAAHPHIDCLVASGNAVRKNPILRRLLSDTFGMALLLPAQQEEAALGAALFGGVCAGIVSYEQAKSMLFLNPNSSEVSL